MTKLGSMPFETDMLAHLEIGKWAYEMDEGKAPRMYCDEVMFRILGFSVDMSPEEVFRVWHDSIDPEYVDEVNACVARCMQGEFGEVEYPWYHQKKGRVYVRCSGIQNPNYTAGVRIEGVHMDITDQILDENQNQQTLKEDIQAIQGLASEYNVLHFLNIETDEYVSYFFDPTSPDEAIRLNNESKNYYEAHRESIPVFCHPDDLDRIMQYGEKEFLVNALSHKKKIVERFLCMNAQGEYMWTDFILLKFDAIDEPPTRVAIGYVDVHEEQLEKIAYEETKRASPENLAIIKALSSIYFTTLEIDVKTGRVKVLRIPEFMKDRFQVDGALFNDIKEPYIQMCVAQESHASVRQLLEFETLAERVGKQGYLQLNYMGLTEGWCRITIIPVKQSDEEEIQRIVFAVASIDKEIKREEHMRYKAEHDELTGLQNRTAFSNLEKQLKVNQDPMAIMIMDIDHFKDVNDTYGHDVGDLVLQHVAKILENSFRKKDYVIRFGGDEFVVIFSGYGEGFQRRITEKIRYINEILQQPTDDRLPKVSVSAGLTTFNGPYSERTFKEADVALYHRKTHGRVGCTVYDPTLKGDK